MNMFKTKKDIVEYHEKLINEIDVHCEKILFKLSKNDENKDDPTNLDAIRELIISKIKEIETFNFSNLGKEAKFCYLIPNSKGKIKTKVPSNQKKWNFLFKNQLGVLIILNQVLPKVVLKEIK